MKIDTSKVVRAVVTSVNETTGEISVRTSGDKGLMLRQRYGMRALSRDEWVEGSTPVEMGEALIVYEYFWIHAKDFEGFTPGERQFQDALAGLDPETEADEEYVRRLIERGETTLEE